MIPVELTISSPVNGNCLQACVASLLELTLADVPNFMEIGDPDHDSEWWFAFHRFVLESGYVLDGCFFAEDAIARKKGIDGYFIGSVKSVNFEGCTHAVIFKGLELAFDPSPGKKFVGTGLDSICYYVIERK